MNFKDLNNTQITTFPTLFPSNKDFLSSNFDLSYDDNINNFSNNEDNLDNNYEEELKTTHQKNIKNNNIISYKAYKVSRFNFFIINKRNPDKFKTINQEKKTKKSNNIKNIIKRGRKRIREEIKDLKKDDIKKAHDKFSDDNMRKKCKNTVLKYALEFINKKIEEQYKDNIGHGKFKKELKVVNQKNKVNSTVNKDKSFLLKTLKEIFSENISARFNNFPKEYNKTLIESLINEEDEEKKSFFTKIFNITFFCYFFLINSFEFIWIPFINYKEIKSRYFISFI